MHSKRKLHTIIAGCVANDRHSQRQLYERFFPVMLRMVRRYTVDEDEQISIINNGFLRVFKKVHTYTGKGSFEGWVRRLMFHAISDYYRRQDTRGIHFMELESWDKPSRPAALEYLYLDDLIGLTERLPESLRRVFLLYAVEGYTHPEISEQLDIPAGTSKWRLSEARRKIKEMLLRQQQRTNHAG